MAVSIEQAAQNALQAWLAANLSGVDVSGRWPDASKALPARAVTILRIGEPKVELIEPRLTDQANIHDALTERIADDLANDLTSAIALLNSERDSYESHRVNTGAHQAADTDNIVTSDPATDEESGITLATELLGLINAHELSTDAHKNADTKNAITVAVPTNPATLVTCANAIRHALNTHYVARIFYWQVQDCTQPIQLDVWATFEAVRDDLLAQLHDAMNAGRGRTGFAGLYDPVENGVLLKLGDGWPGSVDFEIDAPRLEQTAGSQVEGEFRAVIRGELHYASLVRVQGSRLRRAALRARSNASTQVNVATVEWSPNDPGYTESFTTE